MNFNTLTTTLTNFTTALAGAYDRLMPVRNGLLGSLLVIEVVLIGIWWALGHGDQLANVIKKILFIGMWIWLTTSFGSLAKAFVDSLVRAGLLAGGRAGDTSLLLDPSRIASFGLTLSEPLAASLANVGTFDFSDTIIYGLSYLLLMGAFFIMAVQIFLAVLEYYLLMTVASVLVPFGILKPTKFLAEKAIAAVVSAAIKLMVLAFVLGIAEPALRNIRFAGADITLNELMSVLFTTMIIAALTWKAPSLAAGLLAGSPSLGAGEMAAGATYGAMMAGGVLAGAAGAAKAASNAIGSKVTPARASGALSAASLAGGGGGGAGSAGATLAAGGRAAGGAASARAAGALTGQAGGGGRTSSAPATMVDAGPPTLMDPSPGRGGRTGASTATAASTGNGQTAATRSGAGATVADGGPFGDPDKTPAVGTPRDTVAASSPPPRWAARTFQTLRSTTVATRAAERPASPRPPATPRT